MNNQEDVDVLMVGLDEAGKTTILYKLKLGQDTQNIITIGYNVETVRFKNMYFTIWDIGGRIDVRSLWNDYTANRNAVIFVVDAANPERFEEAKQHLHTVMSKDDLCNAVLLVVANKQDKIQNLNVLNLEKSLDLKSLKQKNYRICNTCAIGDWSLEGILRNLSDMIKSNNKYPTIETQPTIQMENQENLEDVANQDNIKKNDQQVLMVGLDEAGKTSLLNKLKFGEDLDTLTTIGYNVETIEFENTNFTLWDMGGFKSARFLWKFYTANKSAVTFVVDAADPERFEEAKEFLHSVMSCDDLCNAVLLIVANKQDKLNNFSILDLEKNLDVKSLKQNYRICETCALGNWKIDNILQNLSEMTKNIGS